MLNYIKVFNTTSERNYIMIQKIIENYVDLVEEDDDVVIYIKFLVKVESYVYI